jgi:hypothetical protein
MNTNQSFDLFDNMSVATKEKFQITIHFCTDLEFARPLRLRIAASAEQGMTQSGGEFVY